MERVWRTQTQEEEHNAVKKNLRMLCRSRRWWLSKTLDYSTRSFPSSLSVHPPFTRYQIVLRFLRHRAKLRILEDYGSRVSNLSFSIQSCGLLS